LPDCIDLAGFSKRPVLATPCIARTRTTSGDLIKSSVLLVHNLDLGNILSIAIGTRLRKNPLQFLRQHPYLAKRIPFERSDLIVAVGEFNEVGRIPIVRACDGDVVVILDQQDGLQTPKHGKCFQKIIPPRPSHLAPEREEHKLVERIADEAYTVDLLCNGRSG